MTAAESGARSAFRSSARARLNMASVLAAELAGDHETLDLVGALADLKDLRVAVEAGDVAVEQVAGAAEDLHRLADHARRHLAGLQLGHGGLLLERLSPIPPRGRRNRGAPGRPGSPCR